MTVMLRSLASFIPVVPTLQALSLGTALSYGVRMYMGLPGRNHLMGMMAAAAFSGMAYFYDLYRGRSLGFAEEFQTITAAGEQLGVQTEEQKEQVAQNQEVMDQSVQTAQASDGSLQGTSQAFGATTQRIATLAQTSSSSSDSLSDSLSEVDVEGLLNRI